MQIDLAEMIPRFLIGGVVVSFFAVIAEVLQPKSFAGLFGAAPSIALATLGMTIARHGKTYAAAEARSMILGAVAFFCYASAVSWVLMRFKPNALAAAGGLIPTWFAVSFALWFLLSMLGLQ